MPKIPRADVFDSTFRILKREGYDYLRNTCDRLSTNVFETRFMLKKTICVRGAEAARLFYDPSLFERKAAIPLRIQRTLLGRGGVHGLDGHSHARRKRMFMQLMTDERLGQLERINRAEWEKRISRWVSKKSITLHSESQDVLCRSICSWAGVPLREAESRRRAKDLADMVDAFGAMGPRFWKGRRARVRTEKWIQKLVRDIRSSKVSVPSDSAAHEISFHRDAEGRLLDDKTAAVELINIIRPTVAVSYLITFAGLALHQHREWRVRIQSGTEVDLDCFVQEVRRFFPFAPFMGARVRQSFRWKGYRFPKGRLVLLDLYGTNRDSQAWLRPDSFEPDRFRKTSPSLYNLIPQGGGDYFTGHRCAGEQITIRLLRIAAECIAQAIAFDVPEQDLDYPLNRMPTFPASGFVIRRVRRLNSMTPSVSQRKGA